MNISNLWEKLSLSKSYRDEFAALQLKRGIPFQIRAMLKKRGWKQEILAEKSRLTQGVVSRAQNPDYGNLTVNTIAKIAAGFDVAFIGKFVPFSDLTNWFEGLSEESGDVSTFEEENHTFRYSRKRASKRRDRRKPKLRIVPEGTGQQKFPFGVARFPLTESTTTTGETVRGTLLELVQPRDSYPVGGTHGSQQRRYPASVSSRTA